jgi:radical SAM protein with 4Fe4S-binding SPASM domain
MADTFCMMPWIHLHIWPGGNAYPCCMSRSDMPLGNTGSSDLQGIWNSDGMKALRRRMLAGERSEECARCYDIESSGLSSLRTHTNLEYSDRHRDQVESTTPDGTVPDIRMAYMDIRWSNICNLRCRTCGPELSSAWYDDHVKRVGSWDGPRILNVNRGDALWDQIEPLLATTEEVYFAGGESMLTEEHYRLLDHWIGMGKRDVRLRYTTNFTVLDYKRRDVFDMWRRFDDVRVAASLDASHCRAEYLRRNMSWDAVVDNRRRMMREAPDVYFELTPTVSLMNVMHLPDFHEEWVELGLVEVDNVRINLLTYPAHTSARVLPPRLKDRARSRIESHLSWLDGMGASAQSIDQWRGIIAHMDGRDDSRMLGDFKRYNDEIDGLRGESLVMVFPELEELYDGV